MKPTGTPAAHRHFAFIVRVQQNGAFYSVANFVENGDEEFLQRLGLDSNGALYKMYNLATTSAGNEKKTRKWEGFGDLDALIAGMSQADANARQAYMYDNMDLPEMINFFTAKIITADIDCCHKNYYLYRDSDGSLEWQAFPWDVDLTFGRNWTCGSPCYAYYDETIYTNSSLFVGYGNTVFTPLFDTPATRQMYLRRLRTLMDTFMQPPGTPASNDFYYQKTLRLRDQTAPDAALDLAKWGTWGNVETITAAVNRVWTEFLPGRRLYLFRTLSVTNGGEIPLPQPSNAVVNFGPLEYRPANGNQQQEWLSLTNPNNFAVDLSGWKLEGGVRLTFKGGTVLPASSALYVSPNVRAFRARTLSPKGGEKRLVVGPYGGNLSAWGEALSLSDPSGRLVAGTNYAGNPSAPQRYLRITEIMYSPSPMSGNTNDAQEFEYLELKNISATVTIDLTGVRLTNGVFFNFTGSAVTSLAPGASVLIVKNTNTFAARYGAGLPVAGSYEGYLDNKGETLRLEDSFGEKILEFAYDNTWYPTTDGVGFSLAVVNELAEPDGYGLMTNWRPSGREDGSPGGADPAPVSVAPVWVNEARTRADNPPGLDMIELHNPNPQAVDIGGWYLTDDFQTPRKYQIPAGTVVVGGCYVTFDETQYDPVPPQPAGFGLGSDGDELYLFGAVPGGGLSGYVHGFRFGGSDDWVSFGRHVSSDGREHFVAQVSSSLGTNNVGPRVGPVVISELMYHPPDVGGVDNPVDEFIELLNITGAEVRLYDEQAPTNAWRVRGGVDYDFATNLTLGAGEHLLLVNFSPTNAAQSNGFCLKYEVPVGVRLMGPYGGKLNNGGDTVELRKPVLIHGTNVGWVLVDAGGLFEPAAVAVRDGRDRGVAAAAGGGGVWERSGQLGGGGSDRGGGQHAGLPWGAGDSKPAQQPGGGGRRDRQLWGGALRHAALYLLVGIRGQPDRQRHQLHPAGRAGSSFE